MLLWTWRQRPRPSGNLELLPTRPGNFRAGAGPGEAAPEPAVLLPGAATRPETAAPASALSSGGCGYAHAQSGNAGPGHGRVDVVVC